MEDEKTNLHEKLDLAIYEKEACKRKLQACSSPEQEDIYDVQIKEVTIYTWPTLIMLICKESNC